MAEERQKSNDGFQWSPVDWPEAAPDILLSGVQVVRSLLVPFELTDQDGLQGGQDEAWSIEYTPLRREGRPHLLFMADYEHRSGSLQAAVSVAALVQLRGPELKRVEQNLEEAASIYAPWVSHVLWDAIRLRTIALLASSPLPVYIPVLTPIFLLRSLTD